MDNVVSSSYNLTSKTPKFICTDIYWHICIKFLVLWYLFLFLLFSLSFSLSFSVSVSLVCVWKAKTVEILAAPVSWSLTAGTVPIVDTVPKRLMSKS